MASGRFFRVGIPIRNPLTGEVYADGRIPAAALNQVAFNLQDRFYPVPNTGSTTDPVANNYRETEDVDRSKPYYATARIDHDFGDNDRLFGRFTFHQTTNPVWEGNLPASAFASASPEQGAHLSYTRILSPSLVSEFASVTPTTTIRSPDRSRGLELANSLGLRGLAPGLPDIGGVLKVSFPGSA